jgi:hypothetical protein
MPENSIFIAAVMRTSHFTCMMLTHFDEYNEYTDDWKDHITNTEFQNIF